MSCVCVQGSNRNYSWSHSLTLSSLLTHYCVRTTLSELYYRAIQSNIQIKGSEVIPVPLYHVLDGKSRKDYVARVEPSALGGKKMADYLLDIVQNNSVQRGYSAADVAAAALTTSLISDR